MADIDPIEDCNAVQLRGRLAAVPQLRELPSGDTLMTFRITVRRPATDRGLLDSIDCVTTRVRVQRSLQRWEPGDVIELDGALRRRFWRGPGGAQSRYAVDVRAARRISPGRAAAASPSLRRASG